MTMTVSHAIPATGFVRIKAILKVLPFSASTWWDGCRTGRFPQPIKLGHRTTVWKAEDIHALIESFGGQERMPRVQATPRNGQDAHELCDNNVSSALTGKVLLSERELVAGASAWDPICGVYFLVKDMRVVYVGQSVDIFARVSEHRAKIMFDSISFIRCAKSGLDVLESLYIHTLKPPRNGRSAYGKAAPLSLEKLLSLSNGAAA